METDISVLVRSLQRPKFCAVWTLPHETAPKHPEKQLRLAKLLYACLCLFLSFLLPLSFRLSTALWRSWVPCCVSQSASYYRLHSTSRSLETRFRSARESLTGFWSLSHQPWPSSEPRGLSYHFPNQVRLLFRSSLTLCSGSVVQGHVSIRTRHIAAFFSTYYYFHDFALSVIVKLFLVLPGLSSSFRNILGGLFLLLGLS